MPIKDIRPLKAALRQQFRQRRADIPTEDRAVYDKAILERITRLWQYRRSSLLLTYVSLPSEIDTRALIDQALADGKQVAVPRCVPNTRQMEFYLIRSLEDLEPGAFGVDEPVPERSVLLKSFDNSLCIVPALSCDRMGYRLGYGKGYYDRFLAQYTGHLIGVCYSECVSQRLPHGRYDRAVDLLVTERYIHTVERRRT